MRLLSFGLSLLSVVACCIAGCATGIDDTEQAPTGTTDDALTSCCVSARNGNDCWRKCDGRWKDLLSNETCSLARGDGGCRAEFRSGGGCWRKCDGRWKDLLPSEEFCRVSACGSAPPPDPNEGCCVSARNGNDCWRKCDGRWKDLLSNETCALARGDGGCTAEFRPGGGCWRKCGGRWKDLLPSEELCQVNACGGTGTGTGTGSAVTLHTFDTCDDFFTVATLTRETDCFDVSGSAGSVKKDGVCTKLPFGMFASEACRQHKPR